MANQQLIRGARQAAEKFTDVSGVVGQAVMRGVKKYEELQATRKAEAEKLKREKQREEAIKASDYKALPALQAEKAPNEWKPFYNEMALNVKMENQELVNSRGTISQFEYIDKENAQKTKVNQLQQSIANIKDYSEAYKDMLENDEFSDALTSDEKRLINDLVTLNGKPEYKDGKVYFVSNSGQEVAFDDLPPLKGVEFELHNNIEKNIIKMTEGAAKTGMFRESKYFQDRVNSYFNNLKMTGEQAKSLAADFLKMGGPDGNYADVFNKLSSGETLIDFDNDGDVDQDDFVKGLQGIQSDDDFIQRVKDQYKDIAFRASDNLKTEYDRINKTKADKKPQVTPYQYFQMQKYEREQAMKNNEYLQRTIPAIEKLGQVTKDNLTDPGTLQAITGLLPQSYTAREAKKSGLPGEGVMLNKKYFISKDMDVNTVRNILANAMADSGFINTEEINDILMAIKPDGQFESDSKAGTIPQANINIDEFN